MVFDENQKKFIEDSEEISLEAKQVIWEAAIGAYLNPDELDELLESHEDLKELTQDEVVTEKTIVRLDRMAKLSREQKVAVFTIAKERKDPLFRKLVTVWRMERFLEAKLFKKYGTAAMVRAKKTMSSASAKPKTSKVMKKVVNRAAVKAKRQFNTLKDQKAAQMVRRVSN